MKLPAVVSRAVLNLNCPRCIADSRRSRVPPRPTVSVPTCVAPGQVADMDNGSFESPHGKFNAMAQCDEVSLKRSGGVFLLSKPIVLLTAEAMVRKYVECVNEYYENILVDLEGCFDSQTFSKFLERQGTGLRFVPTGAHWANKAKNSIELLKIKLSAVFAEYPELPNDLVFKLPNDRAFKLSLMSVNRRVISQYELTRLELRWGRKAPKAHLGRVPFSALTTVSLPPSLSDV